MIFVFFLLGLTVLLALYAIILSKKHPILTFILIPVFVFSLFYTWRIVEYYKGYPITKLTNNEIQLVAIKVENPWILILVKEAEHSVPRYYMIPYNKENEDNLESLDKSLQEGNILKGKFVNQGENENYQFRPTQHTYVPK